MTDEDGTPTVDEARIRIGAELLIALGSQAYFEALDALIDAVRREERERVNAPNNFPVIDVAAYLDRFEHWMEEGCGDHGPMGHHVDYYDGMNNRRCRCGRNLGPIPERARSSEEAEG